MEEPKAAVAVRGLSSSLPSLLYAPFPRRRISEQRKRETTSAYTQQILHAGVRTTFPVTCYSTTQHAELLHVAFVLSPDRTICLQPREIYARQRTQEHHRDAP